MAIKIFSTVGSTYPLDRLTKELDAIGKDKKYEIFAQIGESKFIPKNIRSTKFLDYASLKEKIKWADIIISHAGAGSIIDLIASKKRFILFPRLEKYSEAIDDHQLEIARAFNKKYNIPFATKENEIKHFINKSGENKIRKKDNSLVNEIKSLI
jgi:UDP-N-acetylglucosamine transferase subunit ALG13